MTCVLAPVEEWPSFAGYDWLDLAMWEAFGTATGPLFFLGCHQPGWLNHVGVPLFVSDRRLRVYKTLPVAAAPWALDSGGFTELQKYGTWTVPPAEYIARVRRYRDEIGKLLWAAPQDWMCEELIRTGGRVRQVTFVGTHRTVHEHQWRTCLNGLYLRDTAPDVPWIYVVQGDKPDDYVRHVDMYLRFGVDLTTEPLVGVGSVCRRQAMAEAGQILTALHQRGLRRLHGFGFKTLGLADYGHLLSSADSLAWSDDGRKLRRPAPGCPGKIRARYPGEPVKNCANCLHYALNWRTDVLAAAAAHQPEGLAA